MRMNGVQLSLEVMVPSKSKRARFMGEPTWHISTRQLGPGRTESRTGWPLMCWAVATQDGGPAEDY